jgi:hypothetical protein
VRFFRDVPSASFVRRAVARMPDRTESMEARILMLEGECVRLSGGVVV